MAGELTPQLLDELRPVAKEAGLPQLGAASLDDPGFEVSRQALRVYLDEGKQGEMDFMRRTAEVRAHPEQMLEGARSVLVAAVPYEGEPGPVARYAQWADYHTEIHRRLLVLDELVRARLPDVRTLVCVDTKPLLERAAAELAGLGFVGKSGCLIVPGLGTYVLLGSLLTTATWSEAPIVERVAGGPAPWDACGSCTACLDACPTDAFDAPGKLDPRRCISYLTIEHRGPIEEALRERVGERIAGCDVCQEVCPYNAGAERVARAGEAARLPLPPGRPREPDLVRLANVGNNQHRAFVKHTPLNRIPRRALRRNAILALGNAAGPLAAPEREALELACEDGDAQVAEMARWALARRAPDQS